MSVLSERELVEGISKARYAIDELDKTVKQYKEDLEKLEEQLMNMMEAEGKERTAQYDGLGYVTRCAPKVRANVTAENQEAFFEYLRSIGREDMIKQTVHPKSLSTFVKGALEQGQPLPEFVKYFLQSELKFYPK